MSRNAFVPMDWLTAPIGGEALRTLILISTYANGETGKCNVRNLKLAAILGKSERSIRNDISEIVKAGFLSIENGDSRNRILKIETLEWFHRPGRKTSGLEGANPEENLPRQPGRKTSTNPEENLPRNPEEKLPGPNKNTILEHNSQHNSDGGGATEESEPVTHATAAAAGKNLEPFEAGLPARMPEIRNGVKPSRQSAFRIVPTQFQQSTIDRIYQVLGTDGDDFAAMVSQDQADAGFVEWVMKRSETAKKPIAMAVKLLKTTWREGWTNPNAEEDAQYAELVEMMRSIQQ